MKPHALGAAKKAGFGVESVTRTPDGMWMVTPPQPDPMVPKTVTPGFVPAGTELAQAAAERVVNRPSKRPIPATDASFKGVPFKVADTPIATGVAPAVAKMPDRAAPVPSNPVSFIRHILSTVTFPTRKSAVDFFVSQGVNAATARTQYQLWKGKK
jgi:hypothetical protein